MTKTISRLPIKKSKIGLLFFLFFLVGVPLGIAHLDAGEDRQVGDFVIDLGYSPAVLNTKDRSTLSLFLLNDQQKPLDYDHVWVRITHGDSILFAGPIASEERNGLFTYTFPYPGQYQITVRFFNEEELIVQTEFQVKVEGANDASLFFFGLPVIGVIFIFLYFLFRKKK